MGEACVYVLPFRPAFCLFEKDRNKQTDAEKAGRKGKAKRKRHKPRGQT